MIAVPSEVLRPFAALGTVDLCSRRKMTVHVIRIITLVTVTRMMIARIARIIVTVSPRPG